MCQVVDSKTEEQNEQVAQSGGGETLMCFLWWIIPHKRFSRCKWWLAVNGLPWTQHNELSSLDVLWRPTSDPLKNRLCRSSFMRVCLFSVLAWSSLGWIWVPAVSSATSWTAWDQLSWWAGKRWPPLPLVRPPQHLLPFLYVFSSSSIFKLLRSHFQAFPPSLYHFWPFSPLFLMYW